MIHFNPVKNKFLKHFYLNRTYINSLVSVMNMRISVICQFADLLDQNLKV